MFKAKKGATKIKTHLIIFKNRAFAMFFLGNTVSLFGWGLNFIAVGWIVLEMTGSKMALAHLAVVTTLPGIAIILIGGTIIDRFNRKKILIFLDFYRIIVLFIVLISFRLGTFQLWQIYGLSFFLTIGSSLFWPCASAFTQEIVPAKNYMQANSFLSASYQIGVLTGSAVGGFVVAGLGAEFALWMNAGTYFISALFLMAVPYQMGFRSEKHAIFKSLKKGFSYIHSNRLIFGYGLSAVLSDIAVWGGFPIITLAFSEDVLDMGAKGFGLLDSAYGFGALLATFISLFFLQKFRRDYVLTILYFCATLGCGMVFGVFALWVGMVLYFIMGVANNSSRIISRTIIMEKVPNSVMGRVQTLWGIAVRIMMVGVAMFLGWVAEMYGVKTAFLWNALLFIMPIFGITIIQLIQKDFFAKSINEQIIHSATGLAD